jgi:hypothetical protein
MWSSRIRRRRLQGRAGFSRRRSVSLGNLQNHFTARTGSKKLDGCIKFNGWPLLRGLPAASPAPTPIGAQSSNKSSSRVVISGSRGPRA